MRKITIILLGAIIGVAALASQEEVIVMDPVIITATVQHVDFDKPLLVLGDKR